MIEITNINNYSNKEIFEYVSNHLLKQNEKSKSIGGCLYRSYNGLSCSIGCLIPENRYSSEIEYKSLDMVLNYYKVYDKIKINTKMLLIDLQEVHDKNEVHQWEKELIKLKIKHNI